MISSDIEGLGEGYLIFLIDGKEYGINVKLLSSIVNPLQNYSIGKSFDIRNDSIKIDNEEIPFFDFYDFYNINSPAQSKNTRIIIVAVDNVKTAFYVEQVIGYISLGLHNFLQSDSTSIPNQPFIKWQIRYGQRDILFPDFNKILKWVI